MNEKSKEVKVSQNYYVRKIIEPLNQRDTLIEILQQANIAWVLKSARLVLSLHLEINTNWNACFYL
ncbi:CLUMA_CG001820, isoform A [Clunio marinus]|uniref:CLUMA_CG001820, isoform A n=1 Tax=Clunio marinus TaxID=568069 RepID=A0A1J1HKI0_9DIPT|nr:CLUMA_CG001820, isoform A [Clunio marinus]